MSNFTSGSPRITAINIGIIIALISAGIDYFIINTQIAHTDAIKIIIVSSLTVFILVYLVIYYQLKNLIISKIKPIYKTIRNIELDESELDEVLDDVDIISVVNEDVSRWAKHKTQEIKHLKQMEEYRKEFMGNVMHELKTPIFNIQGYVLTLLDGGLEDENINRKYLERAEKSIDRMIRIVEDLSSISKLETGRLEPKSETFDIISLIKESISMQELKADKRNISLKLNPVLEKKQIFVKADKDLIHQVLTNLIVNSINYGKDGGETFINIEDMDKTILVEVSDNGIGITEEHLPRLFERFYRVDKSRSKESGGTGLGLAIIKHIIEAHKQKVYVRSTYGVGSTFSFTLEKSK